MYNTWHTLKLKEICEITSSKRIYLSDYQTEGIPFYRGKEIIERQKGYSEVTTELFISIEKFDEIRGKFGVPKVGDLLLTSVGTLGVPYVVKQNDEFYFKDGNLTWFRNLRGIDSKYLYYWILSPFGRTQLKKCTIGSSQPAMTIILLKEMDIILPPLPTQRKIAAILSSYDNLIENNLRRIKILEKMAQNLYAEWFAKLRFPGHEKVKMVDSPLRRIPDGWEIKRVKDIVIRLKAKKVYEQHDVMETGNIMVIDQSSNEFLGFHDNDADLIASSSSPIIIFGDHTCKMQLLIKPFSIGPNVVPFTAKEDQSTYCLFSLIHNLVETKEYKRHWTELTNIEIVYPHSIVTKQFDNYVEPLFRQVDILRSQMLILRRTRNLLLPRLISGELDLSALDIKTGDDE